MIELILEERCTGCGTCISICPSNVFAPSSGAVPTIVRQEDCQTCFLCELYCETDALYVHPDATRHVPSPDTLTPPGDYRRDSGWGSWAEDPRYRNEHWRMGDVFARARKPS